nr:hypothetical protein HK105_005125 [Polyrhizophydium stewartii]
MGGREASSFQTLSELALATDAVIASRRKATAALQPARAAAPRAPRPSSPTPMEVDGVGRGETGGVVSGHFDGECFYCGKKGHRRAECRGEAKDKKTGRPDHKKKVVAAVETASSSSSAPSSEN